MSSSLYYSTSKRKYVSPTSSAHFDATGPAYDQITRWKDTHLDLGGKICVSAFEEVVSRRSGWIIVFRAFTKCLKIQCNYSGNCIDYPDAEGRLDDEDVVD